jgi:hypothetical protein
MMLDDAIVAARATADRAAAADSGDATRLRIRESLGRRPRRRPMLVAVLAAMLSGSTAFAYLALHPSPSPSPSPRSPRIASLPIASPPIPSPSIPLPSIPSPLPPIPPPSPSPPPPHRIPHPVAVPVAVAVAVPAPAPIPDASPDAELAAYRTAHEAHFHGSDPSAALAAWNAYLASYPDGTFAVDARYDRSLALIKLHRYDAARAALAPFAAAPPGSYHQADAARLLRALP